MYNPFSFKKYQRKKYICALYLNVDKSSDYVLTCQHIHDGQIKQQDVMSFLEHDRVSQKHHTKQKIEGERSGCDQAKRDLKSYMRILRIF